MRAVEHRPNATDGSWLSAVLSVSCVAVAVAVMHIGSTPVRVFLSPLLLLFCFCSLPWKAFGREDSTHSWTKRLSLLLCLRFPFLYDIARCVAFFVRSICAYGCLSVCLCGCVSSVSGSACPRAPHRAAIDRADPSLFLFFFLLGAGSSVLRRGEGERERGQCLCLPPPPSFFRCRCCGVVL